MYLCKEQKVRGWSKLYNGHRFTSGLVKYVSFGQSFFKYENKIKFKKNSM